VCAVVAYEIVVLHEKEHNYSLFVILLLVHITKVYAN